MVRLKTSRKLLMQIIRSRFSSSCLSITWSLTHLLSKYSVLKRPCVVERMLKSNYRQNTNICNMNLVVRQRAILRPLQHVRSHLRAFRWQILLSVISDSFREKKLSIYCESPTILWPYLKKRWMAQGSLVSSRVIIDVLHTFCACLTTKPTTWSAEPAEFLNATQESVPSL